MKKLLFRQLPIYRAIRGSKLSKRAQDEVLRKLKKYWAKPFLVSFRIGTSLATSFDWDETSEGYDYWNQMHRDSGL